MAVPRRLDDLIARASGDPRPVLENLVGEYGAERLSREARIVFGSWRTRVDLVEDTLKDVLAKHSRADL